MLVWRRTVLRRRRGAGCFRRLEIVWPTKRERDCRIDRDALALSHSYRRLSDRVAAIAESISATQRSRAHEFYRRVHLPGRDRTNDRGGSLGDRGAYASFTCGDGPADRS